MRTIVYSRDGDVEIKLDLYLPPEKTGNLPVCIYLHGGGLVAGSRRDCFFPIWMQDDAASLGFILVAADYRLISPYTAFDQIEDMKALFKFISTPTFSSEYLPESVTLDSARIAVAGFSGGSYVALLAALYADPKPKAVLSFYGMGGDALSDNWIAPQEHLRDQYHDFFTEDLLSRPLPRSSESPFEWHGQFIDAGKRMVPFRQWRGEGTAMDKILGKEISVTLRALLPDARLAAVPPELRAALPEAQLGPDFPPTMLVHGDQDTVVLIGESWATHRRLEEIGVHSRMVVVKGAEHGLLLPRTVDLAPEAQKAHSDGMKFLHWAVHRDESLS